MMEGLKKSENPILVHALYASHIVEKAAVSFVHLAQVLPYVYLRHARAYRVTERHAYDLDGRVYLSEQRRVRVPCPVRRQRRHIGKERFQSLVHLTLERADVLPAFENVEQILAALSEIRMNEARRLWLYLYAEQVPSLGASVFDTVADDVVERELAEVGHIDPLQIEHEQEHVAPLVWRACYYCAQLLQRERAFTRFLVSYVKASERVALRQSVVDSRVKHRAEVAQIYGARVRSHGSPHEEVEAVQPCRRDVLERQIVRAAVEGSHLLRRDLVELARRWRSFQRGLSENVIY